MLEKKSKDEKLNNSFKNKSKRSYRKNEPCISEKFHCRNELCDYFEWDLLWLEMSEF